MSGVWGRSAIYIPLMCTHFVGHARVAKLAGPMGIEPTPANFPEW